MESLYNIGLVIVLYNPNFEILYKGIGSLYDFVDKIVLVDNSPNPIFPDLKSFPKTHYIALNGNEGIAFAQNRGIQYLIDNGVNYILFSDQDSYIEGSNVIKLINAYKRLTDHDIKVGSVGCVFINKQNNKPYPNKLGEIQSFKLGDNEIMETYSVSSSGSLISKMALLEIGGFDEKLFIDGVDNEWGWRAWHKSGLRSFVVIEALLQQSLGEGNKKVIGREISIPSYTRCYYQFRNFIWLYGIKTTPLFWRRFNLRNYILKSIYFPLFCKPRIRYFKNIIKGVIHGFTKREDYCSGINYPYFSDKSNINQ